MRRGVYPGGEEGCIPRVVGGGKRYTQGGRRKNTRVYASLPCLPGVYAGIYHLYIPGYTTVSSVLPGTLSPGIDVQKGEALGSEEEKRDG